MKLPSILVQLLVCFIISTSGNNNKEDDVSTKTLRVFDAQDSNHKLQKHLVQLEIQFFNINKMKIRDSMCSGSVINNRWILTSAHCFKSNYNIDMKIQVNVERIEYNRWVTLGKATTNNIITHPAYVHTPAWPRSENDIALVKTTKPLKLHQDLVPIKLSKRPLGLGQTTTGIISGYGVSELDKDAPRQGQVIVFRCPGKQNLLCSFNLVRAGGGDSGGSLVSKGGWLLGVTSTSCHDDHISKKCGTVYVEVSAFSDWIYNITQVFSD